MPNVCGRLHALPVFERLHLRLYSNAYMAECAAVQVRTSRELGALIHERRTQLRWSQAALAKRAGVSRLWIIQLEKGKRTAQIGLALRALKALRIVLCAPSASREAKKHW